MGLVANTYEALEVYLLCGSGMRNMHRSYGLEVRSEDYGDSNISSLDLS